MGIVGDEDLTAMVGIVGSLGSSMVGASVRSNSIPCVGLKESVGACVRFIELGTRVGDILRVVGACVVALMVG